MVDFGRLGASAEVADAKLAMVGVVMPMVTVVEIRAFLLAKRFGLDLRHAVSSREKRRQDDEKCQCLPGTSATYHIQLCMMGEMTLGLFLLTSGPVRWINELCPAGFR